MSNKSEKVVPDLECGKDAAEFCTISELDISNVAITVGMS